MLCHLECPDISIFPSNNYLIYFSIIFCKNQLLILVIDFVLCYFRLYGMTGRLKITDTVPVGGGNLHLKLREGGGDSLRKDGNDRVFRVEMACIYQVQP